MVYEPKYLRFFQARFEPVGAAGLLTEVERPERALSLGEA